VVRHRDLIAFSEIFLRSPVCFKGMFVIFTFVKPPLVICTFLEPPLVICTTAWN
jgi:hypothetical protein